jgi:CSLREA domain-containing protein
MKHRYLAIVLPLLPLALVVAILALIAPPAWAAGGETFTVNSDLDLSDSVMGDCSCDTGGGVCTLRAAIQEANGCVGAQTIRFSDAWHITPASTLPILTSDGTVIDGSDQWVTVGGYQVPGVIVDGNDSATVGLVITGSDNAVYGLQIIRFSQHGVYIYNGGQNNTIGGVNTQRNVISRNGANGVQIEGSTTTSNTVSGNYVGANPAGIAGEVWDGVTDWGNDHHGISIWDGSNNWISDNLVADNGWSGVTMDALDRCVAIDNVIGVDINGEPLGNGYYGVHVANDASPTISLNVMAFNRRGIHVTGGSTPTLYGNTIYSNTASTLDPPYGGGIFLTDMSTGALVIYNDVLSNTARYGGGIAVQSGADADIIFNTIRANRAYTSGNVSLGGGGIYVYEASAGIGGNLILDNTASGDPTGAPFPGGGGIYLFDASSAYIAGNEIRGNSVIGNAGGGGGIAEQFSDNVEIRDNVLVDNEAFTWSYSGAAIEINNHSSAPATVITGNWIAGNNTRFGGAVHVEFSSLVSLTNNLIVDNADEGLYLIASTTGITAAHNTIASNGQSGIALDDSFLHLYNTLVISNSGYGVESVGTPASGINRHANDVWGNTLGRSNFSLSPFFLEADPRFFDASAKDYALRAGSPCIDTGAPQHATPASYNGLTRPQGDGPDIGAYEMSTPLFLPLALKE